MADVGSIYQPAPISQGQPNNLMGTVAQFAGAQNALNQNALFQQEFRARQALGPIFQQSLRPDGSFDFGKFSQMAAANPDTAFKLPEITNQLIQRELTTAQLAKTGLETNLLHMGAMADVMGGLVTNAVQKAGDPKMATMEAKDVQGALDQLVRMGTLTPQQSAVMQATLPSQKGQERQLFEQVQRMALTSQGGRDALSKTYGQIDWKDVGGAEVPVQTSGLGGFAIPGQGLPKSTTPGENQTAMNRPVSTVTPEGTTVQKPAGATMPVFGGQGGTQPINQQPPVQVAGPGGINPASPTGLPSGSGAVTGQSPVTKTAQQNVTTMNKAINDKANEWATRTKPLLEEVRQIRSDPNFKPGAGSTMFTRLGELAQTVGFPQNVVDSIANGSLPESQELEKLSTQLSTSQLRQALPNAGRVLQLEFETFLKHNSNLDTDPRAADKIQNFIERMGTLVNAVQKTWQHQYSIYKWNADHPNENQRPLEGGLDSIENFDPWINDQLLRRMGRKQ